MDFSRFFSVKSHLSKLPVPTIVAYLSIIFKHDLSFYKCEGHFMNFEQNPFGIGLTILSICLLLQLRRKRPERHSGLLLSCLVSKQT